MGSLVAQVLSNWFPVTSSFVKGLLCFRDAIRSLLIEPFAFENESVVTCCDLLLTRLLLVLRQRGDSQEFDASVLHQPSYSHLHLLLTSKAPVSAKCDTLALLYCSMDDMTLYVFFKSTIVTVLRHYRLTDTRNALMSFAASYEVDNLDTLSLTYLVLLYTVRLAPCLIKDVKIEHSSVSVPIHMVPRVLDCLIKIMEEGDGSRSLQILFQHDKTVFPFLFQATERFPDYAMPLAPLVDTQHILSICR